MTTPEPWADWADVDVWRALCPRLSVEGASSQTPPPKIQIPSTTHQNLKDNLRKDGYFVLPDFVSSSRCNEFLEAIITLKQHGLPPAFLFVYDEPWQIPSTLGTFLADILGNRYRVLPNFWAWHLEPERSDAGWRAHRDRPFDTLTKDGMPQCLTLWIAMTDATPLNGCIYVLPASRDPRYRQNFTDCGVDDLRQIRALPAAAGTVLGWNQAILHWGGQSSPRASQPRVSLAFELQSENIDALAKPLLNPEQPPGFVQRLALIGQQLLSYRHMHPLSDRLETLARTLAGTASVD